MRRRTLLLVVALVIGLEPRPRSLRDRLLTVARNAEGGVACRYDVNDLLAIFPADFPHSDRCWCCAGCSHRTPWELWREHHAAGGWLEDLDPRCLDADKLVEIVESNLGEEPPVVVTCIDGVLEVTADASAQQTVVKLLEALATADE
jgi:hypothetical protein